VEAVAAILVAALKVTVVVAVVVIKYRQPL
jgi:hypothetical protein